MSEFNQEELKTIYQDMIEASITSPQSTQHEELMVKVHKFLNCQHRWSQESPSLTLIDILTNCYCIDCGRELTRIKKL